MFTACPALTSGPVRLDQLSLDHAPALAAGLQDDDVWDTWYTSVAHPDQVEGEIRRRLALQEDGAMAPWAVVDVASGVPVGMTTFMNIDPRTPRLEIGSTWLLRGAQRTGINAHMKLLMLTRAFDDLGCLAVEFRTHFHNRQSRAAIERLGAKQDGVLRQHKIFAGVARDTAVYSIIAAEWPTVRVGLSERIRRHEGGPHSSSGESTTATGQFRRDSGSDLASRR